MVPSCHSGPSLPYMRGGGIQLSVGVCVFVYFLYTVELSMSFSNKYLGMVSCLFFYDSMVKRTLEVSQNVRWLSSWQGAVIVFFTPLTKPIVNVNKRIGVRVWQLGRGMVEE